MNVLRGDKVSLFGLILSDFRLVALRADLVFFVLLGIDSCALIFVLTSGASVIT